jgi:hypothetical protein
MPKKFLEIVDIVAFPEETCPMLYLIVAVPSIALLARDIETSHIIICIIGLEKQT